MSQDEWTDWQARSAQVLRELRASEERYRKLVEASPDGVVISDLQGIVNFVSLGKTWGERGVRSEDLLGHSLLDWIRPRDRAAVSERMARILAGERLGVYEYTLVHSDGGLFPSAITSVPLCDDSGKPQGLISIVHDIRERLEREQELRRQTALAEALRDNAAALNSALNLEQVLDVILDGLCPVVLHDGAYVMLLDAQGSGRMARFSSYERLSAQEEAEMMAVSFPLNAFANLREMARTREPILINDITRTEWVSFKLTAVMRAYLGAPILYEDKVAGFIGLYAEETDFFQPEDAAHLTAFANLAGVAIQKAHLFEELRRLATTDELTGISNRRHFFSQAELEFARVARYNKPLTAMMLDIDHFKEVNDTYGHAVGDQVLARVAQICAHALRVNDLLGRYGGEEFVFLLPETSGEEARAAAERLRQTIAAAPVALEGLEVAVSASIGVAALRKGETSLDTLLNRADQALLSAKQSGRNRIVYFP